MQQQIDQLLSERHDESFDMARIPDQQDKATMLSTEIRHNEFPTSNSRIWRNICSEKWPQVEEPYAE